MKKAVLALLVVGLLVSGIAGMALANGRVAIVFATGGLGDKSFNDSAMEGAQAAQAQLGIEFDYAEPQAIAEYETYLTQFAATRRYDLIIAIGFDQVDPVTVVAGRFPNQKFAIVDSVVEMPNVASYVYKEAERGFLLGVASALMTERTEDPKINDDLIVGVVGGMNIPLINENIAGFIAGAKYVNSEVEVLYSYVGDWADPGKGKELTISMIEQGADVVWGAAGRSGLGVISAGEEQDIYVIGADSDQGYLAPDHVLTNGMKFVNNTVFGAISDVLAGEFTPGINLIGVKERAVGYTNSLLPADVIAELEQVTEKMVNGDLDVMELLEPLQ